MRMTIRAKQIAGVTAIVGVTVISLSLVFVAIVSSVVLKESHAGAQLLANTILHRAREVAPGASDPYLELRRDPGLRSILEAAIYGENVTAGAIVDTAGMVVAHSDPAMEGEVVPQLPDLTALSRASLLDQLRVVYAGQGQMLEVRQPLALGNDAFGSIRVEVSTLLMRDALLKSLRPVFLIAGVAVLVGVLVAALLSQALLRPIHVIRSGLTRLGRGEFGVTLDLPEGDEFGELGSFFNTVSRQLSAARQATQEDTPQDTPQDAQHDAQHDDAPQEARTPAVEALEDAVALFGPGGTLLFSNQPMGAVIAPDAIGRPVGAVLPGGHPYRTLVEGAFSTRRSRGPVHVIGSSPRQDRESDGRERRRDDHVATTYVIRGTSGDLVGVLLVSRSLALLSHMQSTVAYSRKLVALGRLTAGIAHEVKNPLNAMMIHLELLRTKIRSGEVAARRPETTPVMAGSLGLTRQPVLSESAMGALEHAKVIETEIRRLDEVVQGFLRFTRPEDLRLQPVAVAALFDEILPLIEPEAGARGVTVSVQCPSASLSVNGDAAMLRQAFLNLAINACQAMPNGGTLRLVAAGGAQGRVELRVEDTGEGIPAKDLPRIFDLYFTTKAGGTGIGLSMVFRIVQMHDGEVEVESTPGRGTTFRVYLPRAHEM
jgi:signal transduction histidine kinase